MRRDRDFLVFVCQDCYSLRAPCEVIKIRKAIIKKRETEIEKFEPERAYDVLINFITHTHTHTHKHKYG